MDAIIFLNYGTRFSWIFWAEKPFYTFSWRTIYDITKRTSHICKYWQNEVVYVNVATHGLIPRNDQCLSEKVTGLCCHLGKAMSTTVSLEKEALCIIFITEIWAKTFNELCVSFNCSRNFVNYCYRLHACNMYNAEINQIEQNATACWPNIFHILNLKHYSPEQNC